MTTHHPYPTLTLAVSTTGDKVNNLTLFPPSKGISWLILVQQSKTIPLFEFAKRTDVSVIYLKCDGLSNSRNQALLRTKTTLVLFTDDDLLLSQKGIEALRQKFAIDSTLDFAAGWRKEHFPKTTNRKKAQKLTRYNTGRICAPELMLRLKPFRDKALLFDTNFGLGSPHGIGEEYIFLTDALANGLSGTSFPIITASHPKPSTGNNWHSHQLLAARQSVIDRVFKHYSRFIKIAYAIHHRKKFTSTITAIQFAFGRFAKTKNPASKSGAYLITDD